MSSVTKRGSKWYAGAADGRLRQRVTPARTKTEAQLYAAEKERQVWRQREGLDPLHAEPLRFGELLDWWWQRYGSKRRAYSKHDFKAFLAPRWAASSPTGSTGCWRRRRSRRSSRPRA